LALDDFGRPVAGALRRLLASRGRRFCSAQCPGGRRSGFFQYGLYLLSDRRLAFANAAPGNRDSAEMRLHSGPKHSALCSPRTRPAGRFDLEADGASVASLLQPATNHSEALMLALSNSARLGLLAYILPPLLLCCSNVFMTFAWYWHLKFKSTALPLVIVLSWCVALFEYCFAVPANRIGSAVYSVAELKSMQEVITLSVFAGFTAIYFHQPLSWPQAGGFCLIAIGAILVFHG
jgi:uncharacterized protein